MYVYRVIFCFYLFSINFYRSIYCFYRLKIYFYF